MLPAAAYLDDAILAWERRHLFADAWVCVGRGDELAAVGARRAITVGDDAVLLVRGEDGRLRGFFNVCQHRGHELAPCGTTSEAVHRSIHCPYHGWRYGLDGTLLSTPRFEAPPGFDRADHGLVPVAVEEWHGWVLVNVSGTVPAVGEYFAGLEVLVAPYEPERLVVGATHRYEIAANWKIVVENYQECFHCPNIHPELCRVSPSTSGENYSAHGGLWVGGWQELMPHAVTMSLDGRSGATPLRGLDAVARRRIEYLGLLPNVLVSLHPDYVMTHRLEPLAPGRTAIECQWLFAPEVAPRTGSTRRSRSTSGISPTARTGRRVRACSAAPRRAATTRARSAPTRTRWPSSCGSSPRPTSPAAGPADGSRGYRLGGAPRSCSFLTDESVRE